MSVQYQNPPKSPALAAILSALWAGLGQIYNGEVGKGILIMVVQVVNLLRMGVIIGFITGPIVFIWAIYDAYKTAERINAEAAAQAQQQMVLTTKVCPRCAERVPAEAKVCRFCGYEFGAAVQPAMLPISASNVDHMTQNLQQSAIPNSGSSLSQKTCPQCGVANDANAKFCMACGYQFGIESGIDEESTEDTAG
jgi:TM2 domain-containing membrane protein YozV/rubredoxin